jgi:hypothetical protein
VDRILYYIHIGSNTLQVFICLVELSIIKDDRCCEGYFPSPVIVT